MGQTVDPPILLRFTNTGWKRRESTVGCPQVIY